MKTRHSNVDKSLVEVIEQGGYELTDELFFELLKESSDYLGTKPFLNRINEWQKQRIANLDWEKQIAEDCGEDFDKTKRIKDSNKAKKKLQKIGIILGNIYKRGSGRSKKHPSELTLAIRAMIYENRVSDFIVRSKQLTYLHEMRKLFEEEFPELNFVKPYREKDCRTASSLARRIIAAEYNIPATKLRTLIKSGKEILGLTNAIHKTPPKHKSK